MEKLGVGDWVWGWWEGGCGGGYKFAAGGGEEGEGFADLGVEGLGCLAEGEDFGVVGLVGIYCAMVSAYGKERWGGNVGGEAHVDPALD